MFWLVMLLFLAPALIAVALRAFAGQPHWNDASHAATGQAPNPEDWPSAVVQVYAARTWGVRGAIAVHTWIATKRQDAKHYTRFEVIGWRLPRSVVARREGDADAEWFSNAPQLLVDLRGDDVEGVIDKIEQAVSDYPYPRQYRMWPGPNSNTFVAFVARRVPELRLELPPLAIGKDYLGHRIAEFSSEGIHSDEDWRSNGEGEPQRLGSAILFDQAPSGTGFQLSLFGAVGVLAARREGFEVNLLGLVAGVRPWPLAIKLPGLGTWPKADAYRNWTPDDA